MVVIFCNASFSASCVVRGAVRKHCPHPRQNLWPRPWLWPWDLLTLALTWNVAAYREMMTGWWCCAVITDAHCYSLLYEF